MIKILVIDKEEIILKSIRKALKGDEDVEYVITTCSAALEGLKIVRSDTFNLVLLDMVSPGMNGNELLRRIKNIYPEIPVIVMSGYSSAALYPFEKKTSLNEASKSAAGFLLKPFTTEEIKSIVRKVLKTNSNYQ